MPKLEVLSLRFFHFSSGFSGLEFLQSIKEVRLSVRFHSSIIKWEADKKDMTEEEAEKEAKSREDKVKEDIRKQVAKNQNGPILKVEQMSYVWRATCSTVHEHIMQRRQEDWGGGGIF